MYYQKNPPLCVLEQMALKRKLLSRAKEGIKTSADIVFLKNTVLFLKPMLRYGCNFHHSRHVILR